MAFYGGERYLVSSSPQLRLTAGDLVGWHVIDVCVSGRLEAVKFPLPLEHFLALESHCIPS
jgi:hypothetical protein